MPGEKLNFTSNSTANSTPWDALVNTPDFNVTMADKLSSEAKEYLDAELAQIDEDEHKDFDNEFKINRKHTREDYARFRREAVANAIASSMKTQTQTAVEVESEIKAETVPELKPEPEITAESWPEGLILGEEQTPLFVELNTPKKKQQLEVKEHKALETSEKAKLYEAEKAELEATEKAELEAIEQAEPEIITAKPEAPAIESKEIITEKLRQGEAESTQIETMQKKITKEISVRDKAAQSGFGKRFLAKLGNRLSKNQETKGNQDSRYEKLSESEVKSILQQTEFQSDSIREFAEEYVAPKYKVEPIGGAEIYLSDVVPRVGRPHIVAYVKGEGEETIKPRTYYRSQSSMLWRFLPKMRYNGGYGKSNYGEDAINAPFALQSIIEDIYSNQQKDAIDARKARTISDMVDGSFDDPNISFHGGEGDLSHIIHERTPHGKLSLTPEFDVGLMELPSPQECTIPDELAPNFDRVEEQWQTEGVLYGKTTARCFKSHDGSLKYLMFQTDIDKRAWVGAIECTDSKITSTGLYERFIVPGAITTPLYEYPDQAKGVDRYWGNSEDRRKSYVGMDAYLNNIPLIQEFHNHYG